MKTLVRPMITAILLICATLPGWGAVGCDLNEPDRDVKRLFPGSTGFRTSYVSLKENGGTAMLATVEKRMGDKFTGLYETVDVPYTVYEILKGKATAGYIHGVNQKGQYGGIQVFLALDPAGVITSFYIQKLASATGKLRGKAFGRQFVGLSLKEFSHWDIAAGRFKELKAPPAIKDPGDADFAAVMRAVKKNLILMDLFVFHPPSQETTGSAHGGIRKE